MSENMNKECLNHALDAVKRHRGKSEGSPVNGSENLLLEFMVHPGFPSTCNGNSGCGLSGPDQFAQSTARLEELEFLESKEAFSFLSEVNMLLC